MAAGSTTIAADDSVKVLQQLMIDTGWGQIPVVADGGLIGVATRTDLIRLWGTSRRPSERRNVAELLERAISPPVLELVKRISETAHDMGSFPYLVAGLVRDLLLGNPIVDIDMVIEGDAIGLARQLARQMGGRVRTHEQFGTAHWTPSERAWHSIGCYKIGDPVPEGVDLVTARTEFYTHPTALPEVASSSIKQDLHRRDFTVNTMAIRLDPGHWGELLDFYGGEADLRDGVIRVLHSLSFVDDPTRLLRAARFEARLGFAMDPRTRELIAGALPLLDRVSGSRIRHELALIFQEAEPERALCRLDELGVLGQIDQDLRCDEWLRRRCLALRGALDASTWDLRPGDMFFLHLSILASHLEPVALDRFSRRLQLARDDSDDLRLVYSLRTSLPSEGAARPSDIYQELRRCPSRVLAAVWLACEQGPLRDQIRRYQTDWRHVETEISGDDLKAMGLKPGPLFGWLLRALLDARLDGEISGRAEEEALLHALLRTATSDAAQRARKRGAR
jgi:tRNA nucleotidyltransferase (CCA-adding enzyme)